jgi:sugar lactone lactonase YvrE
MVGFRRSEGDRMRILLRTVLAVVVLGLLAVLAIWARYGGGDPSFPDRTSSPLLPPEALEKVADLDSPPGNIAVSRAGRVFFTFHPEAGPTVKVAELVNGRAVPYPSEEYQSEFDSVLSVRIDGRHRLWALDNANHGSGQPRLLAFDLNSGREVFRLDFPAELAGLGSHLNDFQVDPSGRRIYIADASIFAKTPALIVVDLDRKEARRVLEDHPSVTAEEYVMVVDGREMIVFGIFAIRPGVDSIALDKRGEWLYYAPVTSNRMYRIRRRDLDDEALDGEDLGSRVETFAPKTMSDGLTMDRKGNIYITDPEHSAIVVLGPDRQLRTLLKQPELRWPDGLSFGPNGWVYVTCSSLHHVIGMSPDHVRDHAPYQIYRFRWGRLGVPGQ